MYLKFIFFWLMDKIRLNKILLDNGQPPGQNPAVEISRETYQKFATVEN